MINLTFRKYLITFLYLLLISFGVSSSSKVNSHPGRTDSRGCHSETGGSYHCHELPSETSNDRKVGLHEDTYYVFLGKLIGFEFCRMVFEPKSDSDKTLDIVLTEAIE